MGRYSSKPGREVRLERLRPAQVAEALSERAVVYVPFGSIEWHGRQNPVGLDATKAHEQLVGLAQRIGGLVYPPVFLGAGGGHSGYPHSFMISAGPMQGIVTELLHGFERDGIRSAVLLSGHYPNKREYLSPAVEAYREAGGEMSVLAVIETEIPGGVGDHAGRWETSMQLYLHPETVDLTALGAPPSEEEGEPASVHNWMGAEWTGHPCYGILGADPRLYASASEGKVACERLHRYLASWVARTGA